MPASRITLATLLLCVSASPLASPSHNLTFEQRVEAQRTIERVYFSHLTGARRAFEQAVTQELIERKVRTYLKQSAALEQYWNTPITGGMLRSEAERIGRSTRFPERLQEIHSALGHDALLIQETLVRSTLTERLVRNFFIYDERIHGAARAEADSIRQQLLDGTLDAGDEHPRRTVLETATPSEATAPTLPSPTLAMAAVGSTRLLRVESSPEEIEELRQSVPSLPGEIGPVSEHLGSFSIRVLLASESGSLRVASYTVPKLAWEEWWAAHKASFDETRVAAAADDVWTTLGHRAAQAAASPCPPDDTWDNGALDDMPDDRYQHTAVWTGTEMIVWAGRAAMGLSANAGRYDALTDTWRGVSLIGAPPLLLEGTAVWTGSEMIVWGGQSQLPGSGSRYDPVSDSWSPISSMNEPLIRWGHSAVWTGREMIIWGGVMVHGVSSSGASYDPAADAWRPLSEISAPAARSHHTAVWTGGEMIVWGGQLPGQYQPELLASGARYDPAADTWTPTSSVSAPEPRVQHTAIWTGHEMILWGGLTSGTFGLFVTASGARYDPVTDMWTPTSLTGAPKPRRAHSAVWTGTRMIIWSGADDPVRMPVPPFMRSGGLYDPTTDTWGPTSQVNAPFSVAFHTAVWSGSLMIVWGGVSDNGTSLGQVTSAGGRYDPVNDIWTPTTASPGGIVVSGSSPIVWTGTEMLAWSIGAAGIGSSAPGGGGRYDPLTDNWRAISTAGAPAARVFHTAVWTGDEMLVWGGFDFHDYLSTGGRYDPVTDAWQPTSLVRAPEARTGARAVWTGREMILWGGSGQPCAFLGCQPVTLGTGGRYDPSSDTWRPLPLLDAPPPASEHSVVWTGREMIVWGGFRWVCSGRSCTGAFSDRGARYDPERDTWSPLPLLPPDQARNGHSAVWTGREMIVHGSGRFFRPTTVGWIYDRAADAWSPLEVPHPSFPADRRGHSAVWTGRHMLIWGNAPQDSFVEPGVIYDHTTGTWSLMSQERAPLLRGGHTAVWTGSFMLVWGGSNGFGRLQSGGRYIFGQSSDDDGDGLSECGGDCDDADASVGPGASETCNGRDDTCNGLVDEDAGGGDTDGDGTPNACDACPNFTNPGQSDPRVCIAAEQNGGQCLGTQISLAEPISEGAVTLVRERPGPPDSIHLELNVSSCNRIDPVEILLNGRVIATFAEPQESCACVPPLYHVAVSDAALLHDLWRTTGDNAFGIRKVGAPSPPGTFLGTFVGWIKAILEPGPVETDETVCLFDFDGGDCTGKDLCRGGSTEDALEESIPVTAQLSAEEALSTTPFTESLLPRTIDLGSIPDGPVKLCVGPAGSPRFYAADADGNLYLVDPASGASTPAGSLPFGFVEIAHDDLSRRTFAQTSPPGRGALAEIDLIGRKAVTTSPFLGLPLSGLEFVYGKLFGIDSRMVGGRFMGISPDTGFSRQLVSLPEGTWDGLAYDRGAGVFYTSRTFNAESTLWSIDAITGDALRLHPLAFEPSAMEFGSDGALYAAKRIAADTELYRLDTATGATTLIGRMGIPDVVSLAMVRNLPRGCLDIVKQGEQTLAINGPCNSPPSAAAGADVVAECSSTVGAPVILDGTSSTDPDSTASTRDDIVSYQWFSEYGLPSQTLLGSGEMLAVTLPLGPHRITLHVSDAAGESSTDEVLIEIVDTTPPALSASPSPVLLWPPNHRMVPVIVAIVASDLCGTASVSLMSVTSTEPDDAPGSGDGATVGDIQGTEINAPDFNVALRAERDGSGGGRVYSFHYRALDASGNTADRTSLVSVPHDQGGVTEPVQIALRENGRGTLVEWGHVPGALFYNVIRGEVAALSESDSTIQLGDVSCVEAGSLDANTAGAEDAELPPAGRAFFYLVEYNDGWASSYGEQTALKPRTITSGGCR